MNSSRSKTKQQVHELKAALNASVSKLGNTEPWQIGNPGYSLMGVYKKRGTCVDIFPYNEVLIRLDCDAQLSFSILPNSFLNHLFITLKPHLTTADKRFDKMFLAKSCHQNEIQYWLRDAKNRDLIRTLAPFLSFLFENSLLRYHYKSDFETIKSLKMLSKTETMCMIADSLESLENAK